MDGISRKEFEELKCMVGELLVISRRIDNTLRDAYKNNKRITELQATRMLSISVGTIDNYINDGILQLS